MLEIQASFKLEFDGSVTEIDCMLTGGLHVNALDHLRQSTSWVVRGVYHDLSYVFS